MKWKVNKSHCCTCWPVVVVVNFIGSFICRAEAELSVTSDNTIQSNVAKQITV